MQRDGIRDKAHFGGLFLFSGPDNQPPSTIYQNIRGLNLFPHTTRQQRGERP